MKANISSRLPLTSSVASLQVGQLAGLSPEEYGRTLLEQAGLNTLEDKKNAFLNDPGTTVAVTGAAGGDGLSVTSERAGWLVVDSCAGDHRGILFTTFAGAAAQLWSVLSMHHAGTITVSQSDDNTSQTIAFQGMGPLGMKSVVLAPLHGAAS